MSSVDVGQAAQDAARRAQQEAARKEAARKQAEEAARKQAQEAAARQAEEAAAKQAAQSGQAASAAQQGDALAASAPAKKAITSRLTAYEAEQNQPPAGDAPGEGGSSGVPSRFGFGGAGKVAGEAVAKLSDFAAAVAARIEQQVDPVGAAARDEVARATAQAAAEAGKGADDVAEAATKAANAEVALDEADRRLTRDFNDQELQAYKELSVEDRKKFTESYQYLHCIGQDGRETVFSKSAREGFRKALVEGRLLDADKDGVRVLDHFQRRAGADLAPELAGKGVDTRGQLQTLAYQIGHPGSIFQGTDNNTCVAASLQAQMAGRDPGEYMRVATGLVFEGKVTLNGPNGPQEMQLDPSALWSDQGSREETRATTNQLIQQSFMTFSKEKYPAQEGDVLFTGGRFGRGGQYGGGEEGLTLNQAEQLFENVAGDYVTPVGVNGENRPEATAALEQAAADGKRIQVGLSSDRGGHMVGVMGIETDESGNRIIRYSDSNDGAEKTMPLSEFMELATGMVLPSQYAEEFVGARMLTSASKDGDLKGGRVARRGVGG